MSQVRPTVGDSAWFVRDRFGMFIHWGIYALAARGEWVKHHEKIPTEIYDKYFRHFDPDLYDPAAWADAAANAGMKYFVITSKHHDGFCLWDTKLTDYKATRTPAGRDLLRPMIDAFRERGLRVGLYYSLIDWHHPQYVLDPYHGPYREYPNREEMNRGRSQARYIEYMHAQVRELLTGFGRIDIMWFDYSYATDKPDGKGHDAWNSRALVDMVRKLQPHILLDDRLDLTDDPDGWDFRTPEQYQPREWPTVNGTRVVWEACQTFSGAWGYHRDELTWKSSEMLVQMLIDSVSKGGNLLLNVGPTGRGEIDERAMSRLSDIGKWMSRHNRSIYGCTEAPSEFAAPPDTRLTYNPTTNRLYVHCFAWPFRHLHLVGKAYCERVVHAQLLNDASELPMAISKPNQKAQNTTPAGSADTLTLTLPIHKPANAIVPVIELFLK